MEHSANGDGYIKAQSWIFEQIAASVSKLNPTPEGNSVLSTLSDR